MNNTPHPSMVINDKGLVIKMSFYFSQWQPLLSFPIKAIGFILFVSLYTLILSIEFLYKTAI